MGLSGIHFITVLGGAHAVELRTNVPALERMSERTKLQILIRNYERAFPLPFDKRSPTSSSTKYRGAREEMGFTCSLSASRMAVAVITVIVVAATLLGVSLKKLKSTGACKMEYSTVPRLFWQRSATRDNASPFVIVITSIFLSSSDSSFLPSEGLGAESEFFSRVVNLIIVSHAMLDASPQIPPHPAPSPPSPPKPNQHLNTAS